jgi:hypothetical protein
MKKQYDNLGIIKKLSLAAVLIMALPVAFCSNSAEEVDNESLVTKIIPQEMVQVFSFLPVEELRKMALVSKGFKEISEQDILWKDWIPGVHTKKEFVKYAIPRAVVYNLGNNDRISISVYDLFPMVDSGRIFVNDCLYQFKKHPSTSPKGELFRIIRGMEWPYNTTHLTLKNDQSVELSHKEPERSYGFCFEKVEEIPNKIINLVAATPFNVISQNGLEVSDLYIKRLNCLSDNYNDLHFSSYWGYNHDFEVLENLLKGLHRLTNAPDDVKNKAVLFFVQKYVDFNDEDGNGHDKHYLCETLEQIKNALNTNFVSTDYIPPVEYVVANEALPKYIREYYLR